MITGIPTISTKIIHAGIGTRIISKENDNQVGISHCTHYLGEEFVDKFSMKTHYHTCSVENKTTDKLIDFLSSMGKCKVEDDGSKTDGG